MAANAKPSLASEIVAGYASDTKRDVLEEKLAATFAFISKSSPQYIGVFPMDVHAWEETRNILMKYGHLNGTPVDNLFTNEFLDVEEQK